MPAHRVVWTPTMIAALTSMRGQGVPLTHCADLIGVAYSTAVYKARQLGLSGRRRGAAHRYLEAAAQSSPGGTERLRKRWHKKLPAMREAVKQAAEPDA